MSLGRTARSFLFLVVSLAVLASNSAASQSTSASSSHRAKQRLRREILERREKVLGIESDRLAVFGYVPDYRLPGVDIRSLSSRGISHAIAFSAEIDVSQEGRGQRLSPESVERVTRHLPKAKELLLLQSVGESAVPFQVLLGVGGGGRSAGFAPAVFDATATEALALDIANHCSQQGFSGVDVDWEAPRSSGEWEGLRRLLRALRVALPMQSVLTVSVHAGHARMLAENFDDIVSVLDFVHVMAYDLAPPPGSRGHSSMEAAKKAILDAVSFVPAPLLTLGVPLYGRNDMSEARTWREMLQSAPVGTTSGRLDDEVGGFIANSPHTVLRKLRMARDLKLGGIMLWEVGQDADPGHASILDAIARETTSDRTRQSEPSVEQVHRDEL